MNRRKTDLIETQAFANTCVLLDNAKMRDSLKASELELKNAHDLLARAGTALIMLMSCINQEVRDDGFDPDILDVCIEEKQIVDDIHAFLERVKL